MADDDNTGGFLSRWARRKEQVRSGAAMAPEPAMSVVPVAAAVPAVTSASFASTQSESAIEAPVESAPAAAPAPTLADVAALTRESDYARFVAAGVDEGVKRAAMKKLFTDPHFNVMDGLDTYIDDYGKPDPIPIEMLRQMNQSKWLRLFEDEEQDAKNREDAVARADTPEPPSPLDDHADLQLQPDDAAGQPGAAPGPRA
jgi:Protein of unknown function (DUF3306)